MKRRLLVTLGLVSLLCPLAGPAESDLDLTQRYLLLATKKTSTMQKELSEAAAAGYRILVGSPTSGTEMALILKKVATPPETYQYFLLATTRTGTMQKELNETAAKGYRLLPRTMIAKEQMMGGIEIVVIMERPPGSPQHYQYLLLATSLTGTLQREMAQAVNDGYVVVGMVSRGEHMAILEKPVGVQAY